ncbi:MAG: uracil-DNA glycosylase family protein [Candidatus Latescibacterota bacterium]
MLAAARVLADALEGLHFSPPTAYVYSPLIYAWQAHAQYLQTWGQGRRPVVFLGMNPGPWGMAQTGVPFGEVAAVRDWLRLEAPIGRPAREHPARPVQGLACPRSEVSGRRLWGLFAERFGSPERFFADHFVANYIPLLFLEASGRNRTPDALPAAEREALWGPCDAHLRAVCRILGARWVVGVGAFAAQGARRALAGDDVQVGMVLHPSSASPLANQGWAATATRQLEELGVW